MVGPVYLHHFLLRRLIGPLCSDAMTAAGTMRLDRASRTGERISNWSSVSPIARRTKSTHYRLPLNYSGQDTDQLGAIPQFRVFWGVLVHIADYEVN